MIRTLFFITCCLPSFMMSLPVSASLIERDYSGVTGGITYDSEANVEWLDLSFTRTMNLFEYKNYLVTLDDGWKFASSDLVANLFSNFALTPEPNEDYGVIKAGSGYSFYSPPKSLFIELVNDLTILGETMSSASALYGIKGFTSDSIGAAHEQYMAYYNGAETLALLALGDYHRVPTGKQIQSFFTYRTAVSGGSSASIMSVVNVPEPTTISLFTLFLCFMAYRKYEN